MISIKLIRENPDIVIQSLEKRQDTESLERFNRLIDLDSEYLNKLQEVEKLSCERNKVLKEISMAKKNNEPAEALIEESKKFPQKINKIQDEVSQLKEEVTSILMRLPNILHESVPYGKDEEDNVVVDEYTVDRTLDFTPKSHVDLLEILDIADMDRGSKIAGSRFWFLKNEGALLNLALQRYAVDFMLKKGYKLVVPPYMITKKIAEGVTDLADFQDVIYKIEDEDLYMIATSEHPLTGMYMNEIIEEDKLPIKMVSVSPCFRKEAGTHGKDTKGIFRGHQFDKVEQVVLCTPEQSWDLHEELVENAKDFFKSLELPFRIVNICTGDLGIVASKKYDLEAWMPVQDTYREMCSASNVLDYQANRLKIRYRTTENKKQINKVINTLNSTVVASRAMVAILENYQDVEGNVKIPDVLIPYMNGIEEIKVKR